LASATFDRLVLLTVSSWASNPDIPISEVSNENTAINDLKLRNEAMIVSFETLFIVRDSLHPKKSDVGLAGVDLGVPQHNRLEV
jgi:hypothetical protein